MPDTRTPDAHEADADIAGYDPVAAYWEDFDDGGMYRWMTVHELRVRRPDGRTLKASIFQEDEGEGARWDVDFESPQGGDILDHGETDTLAEARTQAVAALQRHGYEPRAVAEHAAPIQA